ncbi:hypothetical protein L1049_022443 [Liquidambar formosana]|uniref:Uncharacterized protein n=1 Tax=Liquidambar formosana TaxID=63359 RepID=A0AAP0WNU0_LIQFO
MNEPGLSRENVASHLQKFRTMLKKKNAKLSQESDNDVDSKKVGHLPNTTISYFGNQSRDAINQHKQSGLHGNSNAQMTHLGYGIPKSEPFDPSQVYLKQSPNQQNMLLQQYPLHPQPVDQMRPRMHVPRPGNAFQIPLWFGNYPPVPEFNGLKFQTFNWGPKLPNDLMEVSSRFPSCSASSAPRPSSTPFVVHRPNSYPSAASFFNLPYQTLGGASTAMTEIPRHNSVVMPVQNFCMGQQDGTNFVDFTGRGGDLGLRGQINGSPFGGQGPIIQDSNENGQINLLQPSQENLQTEGSFHHNSESLSDDDLSVIVKEFGNDGAPKL